jgi:hypothetical protein
MTLLSPPRSGVIASDAPAAARYLIFFVFHFCAKRKSGTQTFFFFSVTLFRAARGTV